MYAAIAIVKSATQLSYPDDKGVPRYEVQDMLLKGEGEFSVDHPRKLFQELRDQNYLSEYSKGKMAIRDFGDYVTIIEKNSGKPAYILLNTPQNRDDLPVYHKSFAKLVNESLLQTAKENDIDVSDIVSEHNIGQEDWDDNWDDEDEEW